MLDNPNVAKPRLGIGSRNSAPIPAPPAAPMPATAPEQPIQKPKSAAYRAKQKRHHRKWLAKHLEKIAARREVWADQVSAMFVDAVEATGGDRGAAEGFISRERRNEDREDR